MNLNLGPAVQREELLSVEMELHGHDGALGAWPTLPVQRDRLDPGVLEDGGVEPCRRLGLVVERQARGIFCISSSPPSSVSRPEIGPARDEASLGRFRSRLSRTEPAEDTDRPASFGCRHPLGASWRGPQGAGGQVRSRPPATSATWSNGPHQDRQPRAAPGRSRLARRSRTPYFPRFPARRP